MNAIELADWIKNSDRDDIDYGRCGALDLIDDELRRLHAENEALKGSGEQLANAFSKAVDEREALKKDAARLAWVLNHALVNNRNGHIGMGLPCGSSGIDELDKVNSIKAIDAAMEQSK